MLASHHERPLSSAGFFDRQLLARQVVHVRPRLRAASRSKSTSGRQDVLPNPTAFNLVVIIP